MLFKQGLSGSYELDTHQASLRRMFSFKFKFLFTLKTMKAFLAFKNNYFSYIILKIFYY